MDSSLIQLLNNGVYNEEMSSDSPPLSQAQDVTNKTKKAKGRSKNFTIQEDMLFVSAWNKCDFGSNTRQQSNTTNILE